MSSGTTLPKAWLLRALDLETDPEGGTSDRVGEALLALKEAAAEAWNAPNEPANAGRKLEQYAERLQRAFTGVPSAAVWLRRSLSRVSAGKEAVLQDLESALTELEHKKEEVLEAAEPLFPPGRRVLTLGSSELVRAMLGRYADRLEAITVSEGRPRATGARLAQELAAEGLPVRLITEAQLDLLLPEMDAALVAAERILPDGTVVARAGTAVLARLCAAHGVPLYVAADSSRWVEEGTELARFVRVRRSPGEVLAAPAPGLQVTNVAFDATPPELVTGYLTETGIRRDPTSHSAPAPRDAEPIPA